MANHDVSVRFIVNTNDAVGQVSKLKNAISSTVQKAKERIGKPFKDVEDGARGAQKEVDTLSNAMSKMKSYAAGAIGVGAILSIGKAALKASAEVELLKKGLSFTLGEQEADRLITKIQGIGEASAYDSNGLMPMARMWVNIGNNVDEVSEKIQTVVDLGSAYGLQADEIDRANTALAQMAMAGKIGAQDMMQLTNANIPAWQLLADKMGLSVTELKDMSSQGALTADAIDLLFEAMRDKTAGAAASMSGTLSGQFSNIEETVQNSMAAIGDIIAMAFDVPGVLTALGEMAEGFKTVITSIRDNAQTMGLGDAIILELGKVSPAAAEMSEGIQTAWGQIKTFFVSVAKDAVDAWESMKVTMNAVKTTIEENQTAIKNLVVIIGSVYGTIKVWTMMETAIGLVRSGIIATKIAQLALQGAFMATAVVIKIHQMISASILAVQNAFAIAKAAALAFRAACAANPILLALTLIVTAIALVIANWDDVKAAVLSFYASAKSAIGKLASWITDTIGAAIDKVKGWWDSLTSLFSKGISGTVRVNQEVTQTKTSGGVDGYAKGGVFGMATGGVVGGLVPLANGGQLKHGTPAIVGEAGPEAVIPLRDEVLSKIGAAILGAYQKGASGSNGDTAKGKKAFDIVAEIKTRTQTGEMSAYTKLLAEAEEKANAVGQKLAELADIQKAVNEEAASYAADGEKTLKLQEEIAKAKSSVEVENLTAKYEKEKQIAIKNAEEVEQAKVAAEEQAANAIATIQADTANRMYSYETALQEAKAAAERANQATTYAEWEEIMTAKDERTGESFATTLANETFLQEQRRAWNEELMLQSVSWGEYMMTTLTDMAMNLNEGLSAGLAQCIVQGKSLGDMLTNLGKNILQMLIKSILEKAIANIGIIRMLNAQSGKEEIKSLNAQAAAASAKASIMAQVATAALIAANPWAAAGAAALVSAQMGAAAAASELLSTAAMAKSQVIQGIESSSGGIPKLANGGIVASPTLAMIGEGKYSEAVIPLSPSFMNSISSGGGTTITQNIYGDINTGADQNDLFEQFNDILAGEMRNG